MDTKTDVLIQSILNTDPQGQDVKEDNIEKPIIKKHKIQCGGSSFELYTHYELQRNIGTGAYGIVCSGKDKLKNIDVAIKKIPGLFRDIIDAKRVLREIKLLKFFDHPNIVKLLDIVLPDDPDNFKDMYLVFQLMHTDLSRIIKSNQPLNDMRINWCMYQILSGLYYMHSADIIHRDLKPNNIFINANCHIKIGDLNLARKQDKESVTNQTDYVVTRWYRAPEVLLSNSEYTQSIDIWSVGCILAELIGRTTMFQGHHHQEQIEKIVAVLGKPLEADLPYEIEGATKEYLDHLPSREAVKWVDIFPFANPLALDLLGNMLVYNPSKRYTVQQCLEHEYFKEFYVKYPIKKCNEVFDWSFDNLELKEKLLRHALYAEALLFQ